MILVDADACPVKEEVTRVALRHKCPVRFIANQGLRLPDHPLISMQVVDAGFDAAVAEAVNGEHTLIVRWIGAPSLPRARPSPLMRRSLGGVRVMTQASALLE